MYEECKCGLNMTPFVYEPWIVTPNNITTKFQNVVHKLPSIGRVYPIMKAMDKKDRNMS